MKGIECIFKDYFYIHIGFVLFCTAYVLLIHLAHLDNLMKEW